MKRASLALAHLLAPLLVLGLSSCRYRSWQHVAMPSASPEPELVRDDRALPLAESADPLDARPREAHVVGPLDARPLPAGR